MSKAFKCDRCKVCFSPYDIPEYDQFISIRRVTCQTSKSYRNQEFDYCDEYINFCPKCSRIFSAFLSGKQINAEEVKNVNNTENARDHTVHVSATNISDTISNLGKSTSGFRGNKLGYSPTLRVNGNSGSSER